MAGVTPGVPHEVAPGVRCLLAPNPGMMTGPGTNTYLLGEREVVVIDPGPAMPAHLDAILAAVTETGGTLAAIWLTHAHPDHASAVRTLQDHTGAPLFAWPTPNSTYAGRIAGLTAPERALADGDRLSVEGEAYEVLHAPGHASDHVVFWRPTDGVLFTGDVIVGLGTVVIAPPDGDLLAYLATLRRLAALRPSLLLPGHGAPMLEAVAKLEGYIAHRLAREAQIVERMRAGLGTVAAIVADIYAEVDPRLHPVAEMQVHGHLLKLVTEGRAEKRNGRWVLQEEA
jgi:glyoxylase-like metal-dependent hydrolase (beta-lactamase superfamily II)